MNSIVPIEQDKLPALIERAAKALASAKTSAEVLEARDAATVAYDAAKLAARFSRAKHAHDDLVAAAHRAQADALVIEAAAKRRLADEYDAAAERDEVAKSGYNQHAKEVRSTVKDLGLSWNDIQRAREIRDAEVAEPGIVRRTVEEALANSEEPTKAKVRRAVKDVLEKQKPKTRKRKVIEPDDDDDDYDAPPTPASVRDAFLVFSNEAMRAARYDGAIVDDRVLEAARATASAWCRLVKELEKRQ